MGTSQLRPGRVKTTPPDTSLAEAARLMHMLGIGSLIVQEPGQPASGMVTDRDLVCQIGDGADPRAVTVASCVKAPLVTIPQTSGALEASEVMRRHGIRRLPIVDDAGEIVGLLSLDDLLLQLEGGLDPVLSNLAEAIQVGARHEHAVPSAHDRAE